MGPYEAYLTNPVTLCYIRVDKPFAVQWRTAMGWRRTTKAHYERAVRRGWVEYQPGCLRPPVAAHTGDGSR